MCELFSYNRLWCTPFCKQFPAGTMLYAEQELTFSRLAPRSFAMSDAPQVEHINLKVTSQVRHHPHPFKLATLSGNMFRRRTQSEAFCANTRNSPFSLPLRPLEWRRSSLQDQEDYSSFKTDGFLLPAHGIVKDFDPFPFRGLTHPGYTDPQGGTREQVIEVIFSCFPPPFHYLTSYQRQDRRPPFSRNCGHPTSF